MVLPRHLLKNGGHARGVFQRRKNTQIPLISLALRPQTIRHPDKCSKLENDATCRLGSFLQIPAFLQRKAINYRCGHGSISFFVCGSVFL